MTEALVVSVADARRRLSDLLDRAARGERVQITRRGTPVAALVPVASAPRPSAGDIIRGIMRDLEGDGFTDEELADLRPTSADGR